MSHTDMLDAAGFSASELTGGNHDVYSPVDGTLVAQIFSTPLAQMPDIIDQAQSAFVQWRTVPAPRRGELVRLFGEELRAAKAQLGAVVTLEAGKVTSEGLGEVQEMIDICDFAVGLSRQIYGLTIASERPGHRMMETWHPMGPCAVISAFNFPVAVWAWNAALALVCGNPVIWKPSEKTPLSALASMKIMQRALARFGDAPEGLLQCVIGDAVVVAVPSVLDVAAAGVELDEAHAFLDELAGDEARAAKVRRALVIESAHFTRGVVFAVEIDLTHCLRLHAVGQFIGFNPRHQFGLFGMPLEVFLVQRLEQIEAAPLGAVAGALWCGEIQQGRAAAAKQGALIRCGHIARRPVGGAADGTTTRVGHHHKARQVLIGRAEAVIER